MGGKQELEGKYIDWGGIIYWKKKKEIYLEYDDKWLGGTLDRWNILTVGNNFWDIFGKSKTLLDSTIGLD